MTLEMELRTHRERLQEEPVPCPRDGAQHWSPHWDRCRVCGTQEMPHRGRGLCEVCYVKLRMLRLLPPLTGYVVAGSRNKGAWSREHTACCACGTTERPHHARGLCARCYMQWIRARKGRLEPLSPAPSTLPEESDGVPCQAIGSEGSTAPKGP